MQTIIGGISNRFKILNAGVIIIDGLSVKTVANDDNCTFRSLSKLLEDEGQYNTRQKAVQYVCAVSEEKNIQAPTTAVAQVGSEKIIAYILHALLTTTITPEI